MYTRKEFPPPASARPLYSPHQFLKCFQIVKHALGVVLVSFALPILLGGSPATAQTTPSQSDTIADLEARLAEALDERRQAQTVFEEAQADSDKADADYVVAQAAYEQAQAAFEALKNDPDRDQVAFRQARETRNAARETMLAARDTRNAARETMVAARNARNRATDQVQALRTELAAAQEAEAQAPILALESQIDKLTEDMINLKAAAEAAAKDLRDAEQRATDAEQRATETAQQVTVAEQETAEAEEQVADLEQNLYLSSTGCLTDQSSTLGISNDEVSGLAREGIDAYEPALGYGGEWRPETGGMICRSGTAFFVDECLASGNVGKIVGRSITLRQTGSLINLYSHSGTLLFSNSLSIREGKLSPSHRSKASFVKVNTAFNSIEFSPINNISSGPVTLFNDGSYDGTLTASVETRQDLFDSMLFLKDRIIAVADGREDSPLSMCEE